MYICTTVNIFLSNNHSLYALLHRMNFMLDFICMGSVKLEGTQGKQKKKKIQHKNFLSTVVLEPTTFGYEVWCSTD